VQDLHGLLHAFLGIEENFILVHVGLP